MALGQRIPSCNFAKEKIVKNYDSVCWCEGGYPGNHFLASSELASHGQEICHTTCRPCQHSMSTCDGPCPPKGRVCECVVCGLALAGHSCLTCSKWHDLRFTSYQNDSECTRPNIKWKSFYNLLEGAFQSVCCVSTMEMVWPPTRFAVFLPVPSWQITGPGSLRACREALDFIVVTRRDMLWPGMANSIHLVVEHMGKQVGTSHQTIHTQSRRPFFFCLPLFCFWKLKHSLLGKPRLQTKSRKPIKPVNLESAP